MEIDYQVLPGGSSKVKCKVVFVHFGGKIFRNLVPVTRLHMLTTGNSMEVHLWPSDEKSPIASLGLHQITRIDESNGRCHIYVKEDVTPDVDNPRAPYKYGDIVSPKYIPLNSVVQLPNDLVGRLAEYSPGRIPAGYVFVPSLKGGEMIPLCDESPLRLIMYPSDAIDRWIYNRLGDQQDGL